MPELAFALSPGQNHFFVEIVEALRAELDDLGVPSSLTVGDLPAPDPGAVPVLVPPHEFFALTPADRHPEPPALERAIFLCAEQPGSWFFDEDVRLARVHGAAVLDVSALGVRAFRREGIAAEHAPLGFSRLWACPPGDLERERDVDVLHLGIWSERRAAAIARCAPALARRRPRIVLSDHRGPNARPAPNFVMQEDKWDLLRRARVLLNVHVADRAYFEWQRVVQAIANGAVVVSEHSQGIAPLEPGVHFVSARAEALPIALDAMLSDEARRLAMARAAYALLRDEVPMRRTAELLAAVAEARAKRPLPPERPLPPRAAPPAPPAPPAPAPTVRAPAVALRPDEGEPLFVSPSYAAATPRVSVLVETVAALDALAHQTLTDLEAIVVAADAETATEAEVWSRAHPDVPLLVARGGLPARAPFTLLLDAEDTLFDAALERLVEGLEARPEAAFAYAMSATHDAGEPVGLRASLPEDDPDSALWRTEALRDGGGPGDLLPEVLALRHERSRHA